MNRFLLLLLGLFLACSLPAAQLLPGFAEEKIAEGLDPTTMAIAPDGRLFIVQKNGSILIVENGQLLADPFLQIPVDNYNERGLGGIALDPGFEFNNYFYIFYTVQGENHNRISRFTANGNFALPESEMVLFELPQLGGTIHNGGSMQFGADGKLYVAVGDGANGENAQNLNTTLGKILRINPNGSIPTDNPFYNLLSDNNRAIWAYGFRNPFTTAMQPGTGRLFANDVGNALFEEVNDILPGRNYGWNTIEGYLGGQTPPADYQDPLHSYSHSVGCAVTGAAFYNPAALQFPPQYIGKYFFGDYCGGFIKVLDPDSGDILETFATGIQRPVNILTAPDGSLYYLERRGLGGGSQTDNTSTSNGVLWRIFFTGSGAPFISSNPSSVLVPVGEQVTFEVSASGAPTLAYQWQRDGIDIPGADMTSYTFTADLPDDGAAFRCQVSNAEGTITSQPAILSVTANTRPEPVILMPAEGLTYRAGDTLFFSGSANDAEDGLLGASQLTWRIDFHHNDHSHPALAPLSGTDNGQYIIPRIGETDENVWYRIYLSATDSEGLTRTIFREVYPEKTSITVNSVPEGLQIRVDGQSVTTPYTFNSVIGIIRSIKAPGSQIEGNTLYSFQQWEDGNPQSLLSFETPEEPLVLTAYYEEAPIGSGIGLTGAYYDEEEHNFDGQPAFWRIDSTINFSWGHSSAAPNLIGEDFFSIRWTGGVEAQYSETYTFYVLADDGIRLWVDDQLIIDQWVPQSATEASGTITLEAGQRYPIKLEYFENAGDAVCQLWWSSARTPKAVTPKTQLYPDIPTATEEASPGLDIRLFPQPVQQELSIFLKGEQYATFQARVFDMQGRVMWKGLLAHQQAGSLHVLDVSGFGAGLYVLELTDGQRRWVRKIVVY